MEIQWCIGFVPRLEGLLIAIRCSLSVRVEELTKKDASKEKVLTHTQRARFDTIFPNYHERFRPRVPAGTIATAQNASNAAIESTTATAAAAAATTGAGDGALPRMHRYRMARANLIDFLSRQRRTHALGFAIERQRTAHGGDQEAENSEIDLPLFLYHCL